MATLAERIAKFDAEIARRESAQPVPEVAAPAVAPSISPVAVTKTPNTVESIEAEIAKRKAAPLPSPSPIQGESRAVKELGELGSAPLFNENAGFGDKAKAAISTMFTPNTEELANILSTIPDIGITRTPEGDVIANNNKTGQQVVINKPGLSQLDITQGLSIASAFLPAAVAAPQIAAGAGATGLGATVAAGVGGAGLTQTVIEGLQSQLGGEFNPEEVAIASALGGAAELVIPAIQAVRNARGGASAAREATATEQNIAEATAASEATGIRSLPAQKSLNRADLEAQSFIPDLPAGTKKAAEQLKAQNAEAGQAVDDLLKSIAPDTAVITGPKNFKTASERAVQRKKDIRAERASPIYNQAFKEGADVDVSPVTSQIDDVLSGLSEAGQSFTALNKVKKLLAPKGVRRSSVTGNRPVNNLKQMHEAKLEIDDMIAGIGGKPLGNSAQQKLLEVKATLLQQIEEASSTYIQASKEFAKQSPPVDQIESSIIGQISKIKETNLKDISKRIFNPSETNPTVIRSAKKVIDDVDPNAWNEIFRSEIERRLGSAKIDGSGASIPNDPGKLLTAIFGNDKSRKVLINSVDGEIKKNLLFLETALKRASLGRPGGSQTAGRAAFVKELEGGVGGTLFKFLTKPFSTTGKALDQRAFDNRVKVMTDRLFNPEFSKELANIRRMGTGEAGAKALNQLLGKEITEETAAQAVDEN